MTVGSLLRYDPTMGEAHGYLRDARGRFTTIDVPGALTTLAWAGSWPAPVDGGGVSGRAPIDQADLARHAVPDRHVGGASRFVLVGRGL